MTVAVLDASAFLALPMNEAGYGRVEAVVDESAMSAINLAEVVGAYLRKGATENEICDTIRLFSVRIVPVDEELAFEAGTLLTNMSRFGLSLGDRVCLALGRRERVKVLTADRIWAQAATEIGVEVELIR